MARHRSLLEIMREGGYNPKAGNPIPIELIYESNVISQEEYKAEVDRQRRVAQAGRNAEAISYMEAEAQVLDERARRAGVPERFLKYAIDLTRIEDLNRGSGIYVTGSQGSHKTTIACSMLRGWLKDNSFGVARFVRATTLIGDLKATFGTRYSEVQVMSQYSSVGLLLVDDLGKENPGSWAVSHLWELFDRRYGAELPTIVTTQYQPDELADRLGGTSDKETALAIVSRFRETYLLMDMGDTDFR